MENKKFNGDRLKTARIYRGYTVAELAEKLSLQRQTVSMYENNKISTPEYSVIQNMGKELGFPIEFFLQPNCVSKNGVDIFQIPTNDEQKIQK